MHGLVTMFAQAGEGLKSSPALIIVGMGLASLSTITSIGFWMRLERRLTMLETDTKWIRELLADAVNWPKPKHHGKMHPGLHLHDNEETPT